ncbi:MAG: hypothetical protein R2774_08760 [Saprospiraceae bacterium]
MKQYKNSTKTVQKQYKNSNPLTFTVGNFFPKLTFLAVPMLLLFLISCGKQSEENVPITNDNTEVRNITEFCDHNKFPCSFSNLEIINNEPYVINGCTIYVSYKKWYCHNPDRYIIRDMTYNMDNSSACKSIKQIWNLDWLNGMSQTANESINQLYKQLSFMIEDHILETHNGGNTVTLHYIATGCHTLCAKEIKDEENPSFFELSQVQCGISCCIRSTNAALIDDKWIKETAVIYEGGNCDPVPLNCDGITNPNICDPACARL